MSTFAARALDVQNDARDARWAGRFLLGITALLVVFGLLSVYSASSFLANARGLPDTHYLTEQAVRAGVGALGLVVARYLDYHWWSKLAWPMVGGIGLLLLVLVLPGTEGIAPRVNGARRWLELGIAFQPSELAKFAVVAWTAMLAVKKQDQLHSFREGMLPFLLVNGLLCALVLLQPHFSAALLLAALAGIVLFAAGARLGHFVLLGTAAVPLLWDQLLNTGYRLRRITAFFEASPAAGQAGYQLRQSLVAVGSGGLFGVGYGESRQKLYYLPEPQNDFIFPIIAEEWGFVGSALLIGLFAAWTVLGLQISASAPDLFGRLLGVGLTSVVALGAFVHFGVTLGLLPTTGMNLPFISAGGTHLVLALVSTGVLLNIAEQEAL